MEKGERREKHTLKHREIDTNIAKVWKSSHNVLIQILKATIEIVLNCLESTAFASLKDAHLENIAIAGPFPAALTTGRLSFARPGRHREGGRDRDSGGRHGGWKEPCDNSRGTQNS